MGVILIEFSFQNNRTRGHEVSLVKDQCKLDIRKHSFSQGTLNELNIYVHCVNASSVNMFKNNIEKYIPRAGHT